MLPTLTFRTAAEPFAVAWLETECDPTEKPGVVAFRDFVLAHQGGGRGNIVRDCAEGPASGHYSGRAWDWMIDARVPQERARADEMIDWLLADGAEMFRRAGLRYIIWDRRIWSTNTASWTPYDGYGPDGRCAATTCRDAHVTHVHFSFGKDGAAGRTSLYAFLRGDDPGTTDVPVPWPSARPRGAGVAVAVAAVGCVVGYFGARFVMRARV